MRRLLLILIAVLGAATAAASEVEIAGITVPDSASLAPGTPALKLNGAGIRKKFFMSIYVGALYLGETTRQAQAVLDDPGPKSVHMYFVYSKVSARKIRDGWNEGFAANHTPEEFAALKARLDDFNDLFPTVHEGDVIRLDYIPQTGTRVWLNDRLLGGIPGADFYTALLRVWLGPEPVSESLREDMLGRQE